MTAANTPTPELEPVAWAFDRPETPYQFWTTNPEADNLKREKLIPLVRRDEAAATIARLTAERDALKENISVWHSYVREGLGISGEDLPFRFDYYAQEIAAVITANKLLSERVAVLETALEPFAKVARVLGDSTIPTWTINVGDLRRALAAREAK